jgi:hypothetical protein
MTPILSLLVVSAAAATTPPSPKPPVPAGYIRTLNMDCGFPVCATFMNAPIPHNCGMNGTVIWRCDFSQPIGNCSLQCAKRAEHGLFLRPIRTQ